MRMLCGCVVACSVLLSSFSGLGVWSQSGTSEPPGLDEIIRRLKNSLLLSFLHLRAVVLLFLLLRFHLIHLLPRMLLRL